MKRLETTKKFDKQYSKLNSKLKIQFKLRINLFLTNPTAKVLHDHALKAEYEGYRSINITGDVRALYYEQGKTILIFAFIGTHSQLYGK